MYKRYTVCFLILEVVTLSISQEQTTVSWELDDLNIITTSPPIIKQQILSELTPPLVGEDSANKNIITTSPAPPTKNSQLISPDVVTPALVLRDQDDEATPDVVTPMVVSPDLEEEEEDVSHDAQDVLYDVQYDVQETSTLIRLQDFSPESATFLTVEDDLEGQVEQFLAAEVNPDQAVVPKLLQKGQDQLSVAQRDEEIILTEDGSLKSEEIGKPENLTVTHTDSNSTVLSWTMKTSYNLIKGYRVYYEHKFTDIKTFHGHKPEYKLTGLQPHTSYRISVAPVGARWDTEGEHSDIITVTTDTDKPSAPFITNATCYESLKIYLEWKRPKIYYRSVDFYFIYYRVKNTKDYKQYKIQGSTLEDDQKFFLEESTSNLKGNQIYQVKISAGTKSIKNGQTYEGEASKEVEVNLPSSGCQYGESSSSMGGDLSVGVLVGAVTALCLLLISLVSFVVWKKHIDSSYSFLEDPPVAVQRVGIPDWEGEPGPDGQPGAINVLDFPGHVARLHADSDIGFSREYNEILRYSADFVNATSEHSQHPDNKHKNRYLNIVAYDHSRVQLSVLPGQKRTSDYINASFIDGFQKFQAYIGSQGPLDDTFEAFWRMIWEQNVHVLVMITNLLERGRKKCDMYWPKEGSITYGHIEVTAVSEKIRANYTVRVLKLKHNKVKKKKWACNERTVTQFHYTGWPDHGTPADLLPVLSFIRKSSACNPADGGPIIVHCSAGVGRTGTYIVIDAMMKQAGEKNELNVYGFLKHIRSQRNHLVQTEEQYIFLHDALVESLTSGVTEISLDKLSDYVSDLTSSLSGFNSCTLLEKQYANVVAFSPKEYDIVAARKSYNESKNRAHDLVPLETSRVGLTPKPCVEGSDYINASWLQGYEKLREFIVTQHPSLCSKDEFWGMLWDHNAQTVVLLTSVDTTQDLPVFWPGLDEEYEQECFKVKFICSNELPEAGYSTMDFVISSRYDDYELKVRMIQCAGWPQRSNPLHKVIDFVKIVQEWHLEYQNGPLVVVDRYGGTEAATFCALTTLNKQIDAEEGVDVYQICKLYHNKRPGIWRSQEDYLYIYRVLESLAGNLTGSKPDTVPTELGASSDNIIERRHSSSEWRGSGHNIRITVNRRHSLPYNSSTTGLVGGQDCVLDMQPVSSSEEDSKSTSCVQSKSSPSSPRSPPPVPAPDVGDVEEGGGALGGAQGSSSPSFDQESVEDNGSRAVLVTEETSFSQ